MSRVLIVEVQKLRERTGAGVLDCQKALQESQGNIEKAIEILRIKGLASAAGRTGKTAQEGVIGTYVHPGSKLGVLIEINCETDFVARTEDFQQLVRDLALQVAGADPAPLWVTREEVPAEWVEREREIYRKSAEQDVSRKPPQVVEKILEGRLQKFYKERCLLEQPFVREPSGKTAVKDLVSQAIAKLGENIIVRRFARFRVGETV